MKYRLFALLFLVILLFVYWPAISNAARRNLVALEVVRTWSGQAKDPSQIICEELDQGIQTTEAGSTPVIRDGSQSAIINAARQAYYAGDCESAVAYWKLAAQKHPLDSAASILLFLSSGLDPEMLPSKASMSEMAAYLSGLGLMAEQNKADTQAQYWFNAAFELQPSRSIVTRLVSYQDSPAEEAKLWLKLAETLPENDPDHWWALGKRAELDREWDRALEAYTAGANLSANPYQFILRRGLVLVKLERLEEAEDALKEAVSLRPLQVQPYLQLGHLNRSVGDHDAARIWYEQAVDMAPDRFAQNYYLGLTYYTQGEHELAEQYLGRSTAIDPSDSLARYYLAQAVYHNGRRDQAQEILEEAVHLDGDGRWQWLDMLGDWRYAANDREGALEAYYRALQLKPDQAELLVKIQNIENP